MSFFAIILSAFTVFTALGVVLSRRPLNSALWLVATLFLVAGHFAYLDAHFLAVIQVMLYAGAIMVLVIFVIMLLGIRDGGEFDKVALYKGLAVGLVLAGFVVIVGGAALRELEGLELVGSTRPSSILTASGGGVKEIGQSMFTDFLLPFELTSILLLAAIVGAVVLTLEPKRLLSAGRGLEAKRRAAGAES